MKIWVTGSTGMLGSAILGYCKNHGIEAIGTDRQTADICNLDPLCEFAFKYKPTHIINCAAYTDVDGAEKNPALAFAVNAEGAANMALAAKRSSARLIHISTDYVFNGLGPTPYCEEDRCAPLNIYGMSKWEGEKRVLDIFPKACILRTSWLFGSKGKNLISSLLHLFGQKEELQVVCDQKGKPTYCHDLAKAVISLLNFEGIIHFSNEGEASRYEIALALLEALQEEAIAVKCQKITPVPSAQFATLAPRPTYSVLDTNKYFRLTSNKPRRWNETLIEFLSNGI